MMQKKGNQKTRHTTHPVLRIKTHQSQDALPSNVSVARSLAREPKGLEPNTRKREKGNRNLLGLVFPIENGLVLAKFAVDVGLESEKYKTFIRKLYIFQSALKNI